jgi:anti-sigma factor RsiW
MDCVSLERYLEAYLEGRLRRAQWLVLRRHVMTCPHCRARVEQLRQFEMDLHQRFRSMSRTQRLWTGLELDLVGLPSAAASADTLPPKPPRPTMSSLSSALLLPPPKTGRPAPLLKAEAPAREQRWPIVAILCLVLASVGTGAWLVVRPNLDGADELTARLEFLKGPSEPATGEPGAADPVHPADGPAVPMPAALTEPPQDDPFLSTPILVPAADVPAWLDRQMGRRIDLSLPKDVAVAGGSELNLGAHMRVAVIATSPRDGQLMILPTVDGMDSASADVLAFARRNGLAHVIRRQDGVTFDVLGAVPPARLEELFLASTPIPG